MALIANLVIDSLKQYYDAIKKNNQPLDQDYSQVKRSSSRSQFRYDQYSVLQALGQLENFIEKIHVAISSDPQQFAQNP